MAGVLHRADLDVITTHLLREFGANVLCTYIHIDRLCQITIYGQLAVQNRLFAANSQFSLRRIMRDMTTRDDADHVMMM